MKVTIKTIIWVIFHKWLYLVHYRNVIILQSVRALNRIRHVTFKEDLLLLRPLLFFSLILLIWGRARAWEQEGCLGSRCMEPWDTVEQTQLAELDCCTGQKMSIALSSVAPAFLSQIYGIFFSQNSLHCIKWDGSLSSSKCNRQDCYSLPEKPNCIWFALLVHTQLRASVALLRSFLHPEVDTTN